MSIIERITATEADIAEYRALEASVADLQNQILTAGLQHGNDQQALADLTAKFDALEQQAHDLRAAFDADEKAIAEMTANLDRLNQTIVALKAQLAALPQGVTYPDLEWGLWMVNTKPDAASGRGTATFTPADNPKIPALYSIIPDPPLAGEKDNFFNVFSTQKKLPNAAITNFLLAAKFDFPSDADMKNAHCVEMEVRQVLKLATGDTLPLMAVPAFQLNFSGNAFRYFNALAPGDNWIPTGIPMPRQRSVAVEMEAHRDDKTLYYDAFTINGVRHAVSFQAPLYAKTYVNERLSVSLQLDSHYLGGAFKVIPSGISLEVW